MRIARALLARSLFALLVAGLLTACTTQAPDQAQRRPLPCPETGSFVHPCS
jgi:outer membrane PBP1 activator LpoA protein